MVAGGILLREQEIVPLRRAPRFSCDPRRLHPDKDWRTGGGRSGLQRDRRTPIAASKPNPSLDEVGEAIRLDGVALCWQMREMKPGYTIGTLNVHNHIAFAGGQGGARKRRLWRSGPEPQE